MLTQKKRKMTKNPRHPQKPLLLMTILSIPIVKYCSNKIITYLNEPSPLALHGSPSDGDYYIFILCVSISKKKNDTWKNEKKLN